MRVVTSKSKNAESFYISKGYVNDKGVSTSVIVRKLGTLKELLPEHGPTRDDVMAWAREQARIETLKYKQEKEEKQIKLTFHADRLLDYHKQTFFRGGYLFLQSIYYQLNLDQICRKIRTRHNYKYDLNAILSDLIYTRILDPGSKRSSFQAAKKFLEPPRYELHDSYRALSILAQESTFIQSEVYKNSCEIIKRNQGILYYDCTNYYFEIEQEEDDKQYAKSKENRPNPIIQMGLFTDGDGIPLAFSLFPGNQNEQKSLSPLEKKVIEDFECKQFIYCSDAGLASENNRLLNHTGKRAFIVTQSIKKLRSEYKTLALNRKGFRRLSDNQLVDIDHLSEKDYDQIFYKEEPYNSRKLQQRLLITYSPKYAAYQKTLREKQVERAMTMIKNGNYKREKKNPNDPARFLSKEAVTKEGEIANILYYLDEEKVLEEAKYDGLYAVCTDLFEDDPSDILRVSEGRWQIEACFRIMKTEFHARPVYLRLQDRIHAHFLICFLSLLIYRILEKKLGKEFTCEEIIHTLKDYSFADVQGQGFLPIYTSNKITDQLQKISGFATDYEFITKRKMKEIQKLSKKK